MLLGDGVGGHGALEAGEDLALAHRVRDVSPLGEPGGGAHGDVAPGVPVVQQVEVRGGHARVVEVVGAHLHTQGIKAGSVVKQGHVNLRFRHYSIVNDTIHYQGIISDTFSSS